MSDRLITATNIESDKNFFVYMPLLSLIGEWEIRLPAKARRGEQGLRNVRGVAFFFRSPNLNPHS